MIQFLIFFLLFHLCKSEKTPPIIVEQPQDLITELDKPMAIHCRAESSSLDDLHIDWYKDGRLVTTDANARIITEFMALHVINTMPQDAGVYYCIAKNSYGQTQSRKARIQFLKLDKEFPVSPISTSALIGENIRLRCQPPYGSPSPTVYWTKNGKNLSMPLDHYDLILPSIQQSDFGSYRCIASNGIIRQSSLAYLTEFHRPKITIQPSSSRIDLRRGQSIDLECQIDNNQYDIEWHFQNKIIRNNTIHISSINFNQNGIYTCVGRLGKRLFNEEILLAVYDHEILNNKERFFSQTNLTGFIGRSAVIDCQLPFNSKNKILWTIVNQTNIKFDFIDQYQYRLKINRIEENHNQILFECYYENKNQQSQGLIKLNVEKIPPPPIITYIPNNQTVPIGVEVTFSCQSNEEINIQWWFTRYNRPYKSIKIDNNRKYRIETNHNLIIRYAEKHDAGVYKCISTNANNDETTWIAHLHVEDPRSNAIFKRVENKNLPHSPSQPLAISVNNTSIELTWNIESTDIVNYLIEYFEIKSDNKNLQWEYFQTKNSISRQILNNLKSNSIYQFQIRARNSLGYGLPSILSELILTKNLQQSNDELIYLYEPINIQPTSLTIKWDILQKNNSINRFFIYIANKKDTTERIETVTKSLTTYTINNLRPNIDYSIYVVPILDTIGRSSNIISVRTLESIPLSSPTNIIVQLISTTSLSIQWNPPLENETNGEIIAYKVNCLTSNETNSIRLTNITSDAKGLYIKNLFENLEYCISIAARTQVGYSPYSQPICITMKIDQNGLKHRLREAISQPWFLPVIILSSILITCAFTYSLWLCFHYLSHQSSHRIKFNSSSSSSNQSVELPIQKTLSNGKRYDLIQDKSTALWMNSIPNNIHFKCCTTTTASSSEHSSINIHKNPINALLHESRQQQQQLNPYATTGIFQQNNLLSDQQQIIQYQPPWIDHQSSSTVQYPPQSHNHHYCVQCTSQSHPHTPSGIRTTLRSQHKNENSLPKTAIKLIPNSSPLITTHPIMINSLGGETMTTSWSNSIDDQNHHQSISSSSSTDKDQHVKSIDSSSEGSIFSDIDNQQNEESNKLSLVQFERGPSFLIPDV